MIKYTKNLQRRKEMMSKQTAVEYLIQEIKNDVFVHSKSTKEWNHIFQQAEAMEWEQIVNAVDSIEIVNRRYYKDGTFGDDKVGKEIQMTGREYIGLSVTGELYYKQTYGGDK